MSLLFNMLSRLVMAFLPKRKSFLVSWLSALMVASFAHLHISGILKKAMTLNSRLQHQSSKASILWHSAFFIVQLSHPYMTSRKNIALTRRTLVGKVMSPLFNILSRLVIAFLPRSKHFLISWLQSPSAVIWNPRK